MSALYLTTLSLCRYDDEEGDTRLTEAEETVKELERQVSRAEEEVESLQEEIAVFSQQISESDNRRSTINANIRYREAERKIADIQKEIESIDIDGAAKAKKDFDTRYDQANQHRTDQHGKHQQLIGEISQMKESLRRMQKDLASEYKNIQEEYTECLVKFKTGQMASADLDKYGKALDNAIMQYHGLKMQEVNDNLQGLWHEVYTGTDIDFIAIRAEAGAETATRRTYNYRVVMVKNQTELDMRGRCSAGQKVLASILIRIALAESLSLNCGVLALDEPTTNLDVDHIESLARSLAQYAATS
jgi:DNA repair protein RAD50